MLTVIMGAGNTVMNKTDMHIILKALIYRLVGDKDRQTFSLCFQLCLKICLYLCLSLCMSVSLYHDDRRS